MIRFMQRTVGIVFFTLFLMKAEVSGQVTTVSADYFPMEIGRAWYYSGNHFDVVGQILRNEDGPSFLFKSYNNAVRQFIKNEQNQVFEIIGDNRRMWYDFSAQEGATWTIPAIPTVVSSLDTPSSGDIMDGTQVTLVSRNETVAVPYGPFDSCIHFSYQVAPGIADAGLLDEWFAPGIGCVKRTIETIAGPVTYELEKMVNPLEPPVEKLSLQVLTDKDTYQTGDPIEITVLLKNNTQEPITLQFNSSYQADYMIDGRYRWGEKRSFTQALTSVTIEAGGTHEWKFTHRPEDYKLFPGKHYIVAYVDGYVKSIATISVTGEVEKGVIKGSVLEDFGVLRNGSPLQGAQVVVYRDISYFYYSDGSAYSSKPPESVLPIESTYEEYSAVTSADGSFVIEGVPLGGVYTIVVGKEGYEKNSQQVDVDSQEETVNLKLKKADSETWQNLISNVINGVLYEVAVEKFVYSPQETLNMKYKVTSLDRDEVTIEFPTGQQYEFILKDPSGKEFWKWSDGKAFTEAFSYLKLNRGDWFEFEESVDLASIVSPPLGTLILYAYLPCTNLQQTDISRKETEIYVKLQFLSESVGSVKGTVSEDVGALDVWIPISGAKVIARPLMFRYYSGKMEGPFNSNSDIYSAETTEDGTYKLEGLPIGMTYDIVVSKDGYEPAYQQVSLWSVGQEAFFRLRKVDIYTWSNVAYFQNRGLVFELATDRHLYKTNSIVEVRYRVVNTGYTPTVLKFGSGQKFDMVLQAGKTEVWRWSANKDFAQEESIIKLDVGQELFFREKFELGSPGIPTEGEFSLSAYLTASTLNDLPLEKEETEVTIGLAAGEFPYAYVDVVTGSGEVKIDLVDKMGLYLEMGVAPGAPSVNGGIAVRETKTNQYGEIPGYRFIKALDISPNQTLKVVTNGLFMKIFYTDGELRALGITIPESIGIFYWDDSAEEHQWVKVDNGVNKEENYFWARLPDAGSVGVFAKLMPTEVNDNTDAVSIKTFSLGQNYPNPFNPETTIAFTLPNSAQIKLAIFNLLGQEIRVLIQDKVGAGLHQIRWDGRDNAGRPVSSGIYLYRLSVADGTWGATKRMTLVR